jgi:hypothetical protein
MQSEPTEPSPYLPATSPEWVQYYKRAKATRRLGKGQHSYIQRETKRRRRHEYVMVVVSTAVLAAVIAAFCALLGTSHPAPPPESEGNNVTTPTTPGLLPAHARRG